MKKIQFSMLVTLPCCFFILNACTPDVPSENPHYIDGLQFNPDYFQGPDELTAISPVPGPCFPGQGNCIMVLPSSQLVTDDMSIAFSDLKRYLNNKDTVGFFSSNKNWDKLFPGLKQDPIVVKELMKGTYKMQVARGNKAIVIYKGAAPGTGNIIKAYWYNNMN
jgi:hypothetical protein